MFKISDKVMNFTMEAMENWKTELVARRKNFAKMKIK